ncbi:MAG: FtsX-like permease family protein [Dehalococcoidia bacterium]
MPTFASILRLVVRRSAGNWRLLINVAVGILLAATLLAATPIYADAIRDLGLSYALRTHDRNKLDVQIHLGSLITRRHDNDVRNEIIANSIRNTIGPFVRARSENGHSATFFPSAVGEAAPADDNRPRAFFQYFSDFRAHVRLLSGQWPASQPAAGPNTPQAVPVLLSKQTSDRLHLQVGQAFDLHPFWRPPGQAPVRATIVGLIEPLNLNEEYWLGATDRFDVTTTTWATYPFFVDEKTFVDTIAGYLPDMDADYTTSLYMALDRINGRNATQVENGLRGLSSYLGQNVERTTVDSQLPDIIQTYRTHLFFTRIPLFALIIQIVGVVLYYVVMVGTMLVDRQAGEIALLKSRGAGTGQILAVYAIEGGSLGLLAVALGPLLAGLSVTLLGPTPPFHNLSGGGLLAIHISTQAYLLALLGAVLAVAALLWPAYRAARFSIVHYKQSISRPPEQPIFLRYYLDLFLIGVGAFAFYELRQHSSLVTTRLLGTASADPLLLAAPTLFMLMIALVFLRLFPLLLRLVTWLVGRVSGASVMLGLWHMVRSPVHYSRLILLLILATSVAMFSAGFRSTLDASYADRAAYQAGADLRLAGLSGRSNDGPAGLEARAKTATGAVAASSAARLHGSYSPAPYRSVDATLLAVNSANFAQVAFFRDDFAANSLHDLLKPLTTNRPGALPGIPLPDAAQFGVWMLNPDNARNFQLGARLVDAGGRLFTYTLVDSATDSNGWHFFRQDLVHPSVNGRSLTFNPAQPVRLQSLFLNANPVNTLTDQRVTLYFDDLQTTSDGRGSLGPNGFAQSSIVDGFEDVADLEPIDGLTQQPTVDSFTRGATHARSGHYSGELTWTRGRSSPALHGFRVRGDRKPVEVLASDDFLTATGSHVGQTVSVFMGSSYVPAQISGSFQYFPTFDANGAGHFLVADLARLAYAADQVPAASDPLVPNEVWLKQPSPPPANDTVLKQRNLGADQVFDRAQISAGQQRDPLVAASWEGILFLALVGVLLLTALGFLVYSYLSAQGRSLEFAILRTMGFSSLQIAADVVFEQCFVIGAGLFAGTLLGLPLGRLMIGYMGIDESGATVVPPFVSSVSWATIVTVYGLLALVFLGTIVALVVLYSRLAVSRVLRMGEL